MARTIRITSPEAYKLRATVGKRRRAKRLRAKDRAHGMSMAGRSWFSVPR